MQTGQIGPCSNVSGAVATTGGTVAAVRTTPAATAAAAAAAAAKAMAIWLGLTTASHRLVR